jgi:hypothetical protein
MADWNLPLASSLYVDVLNYLRLRDEDAVTLNFNVATNIPEHALKYERNINVFQEWLVGVWVNKVLSMAGGGTGATNPNDIRLNLGLGSMALQHASSVAITGGTLNGVTITNVQISQGNIMSMTEIQGVNIRASGNFVGDGSLITNLNAAAISHNIVNPARLGTGTPNNTSFLRGDSTWQVVSTPKWTPRYVYDHAYVSPAEVNGMIVLLCHGTGQMNIHLPFPNATNFPAPPYGAIRIQAYYGTANLYGGYPGDGYAPIGGRPAPFQLSIPQMTVDLIPDPPTGTWNVY